jgi:hypothetical protein
MMRRSLRAGNNECVGIITENTKEYRQQSMICMTAYSPMKMTGNVYLYSS